MAKRRGPTPRKPTRRTVEGIPGTVEPGYREQPIVSIAAPDTLVEAFVASGIDPGHIGLYRMGACNIIVSRDPVAPDGDLFWNLTISTPSRHPTWDEIKTARYRLLPLDLTFAMFLPPPEFYVNVEQQDHVFQLWETRDERTIR